MAPALQEGLRATKIQSRLPRDLTYGPLESQGIGIVSIHTVQLIEHIQTLAQHLISDTLTGSLLRHSIEVHIIELGTKHSFWELDPLPWKAIFTKSWIRST